ncbi:hypothetical protein OG552_10450 [Streptomyces sp. NBC_01476]|uniref:hypothetical protein n=1 Tax=Streptomyces sp. NBC_01476 TaxID=2903881 RepID=UPI002E36A43F|nr:hypothetical protein [Streptomyces sp. NBC_01476]
MDIRIDGAAVSDLRRVENSALRMLAALQQEPPAEPEPEEVPFGFSLSADTERAAPPPLREHDVEQDDEPYERGS